MQCSKLVVYKPMELNVELRDLITHNNYFVNAIGFSRWYALARFSQEEEKEIWDSYDPIQSS